LDKSAIHKIEHIVQIINDYQQSMKNAEAGYNHIIQLHTLQVANGVEGKFPEPPQQTEVMAEIALARIKGYLE